MLAHRPLPRWLSDKAYTRLRYALVFGRLPNLQHPRSFNEHIGRKKLLDRNPLLPRLADKFAVRQYIADKIGQEYLTPLYMATTSPQELCAARFSTPHIIKATHGSGWNLMMTGSQGYSKEKIYACCTTWLGKNYYHRHREWGYKDIPPRLVVEKLLMDEHGCPTEFDYKFYCFGGEIGFIQLDGWHTGNLFDPVWQPISVCYQRPRSARAYPVPACLQEMSEIARTLSQGLDFVRVDLYHAEHRVYFGEMTHYPWAGFGKFSPHSYDLLFGSYWPTTIG